MLAKNGLYGHIRHNDTKSVALFLGFVVAVEIIALGFFAPVIFLTAIGNSLGGAPNSAFRVLHWYLLGGLGVGFLWFAKYLFLHVRDAREGAGFAFIERGEDRRFHDLLEQLAIANGLPCPRAAIIPTPALNAFACGLTRRNAIVVVTRGLLDSLDDDELAAVLAHELAHIRLGDIRLMACAHAALAAILAIEQAYAPRLGKRGLILLISPIHLLIMLAMKGCAGLARMLAYLARIMISRSREFVADATAVEMTKNPGALITALEKISGRSQLPPMPSTVQAMLIDGPAGGGFATHPSIRERIAALHAYTGAMVDLAGPRKDTRERASGTFGPRPASATPGAFGKRGAHVPVGGFAAAREVLKAAASGQRGEPPPSQWKLFMSYSPQKKFATIGGAAIAYVALVYLSPYLPGMGGAQTFSSVNSALKCAKEQCVPAEPKPVRARPTPPRPAASTACAEPSCASGLRNTLPPR